MTEEGAGVTDGGRRNDGWELVWVIEARRTGGGSSGRLTPHLTSPLEEKQTFAQPRISLCGGQPDQIEAIGLHRRIWGSREGLLEGGRDELGEGAGVGSGWVPACAGMTVGVQE